MDVFEKWVLARYRECVWRARLVPEDLHETARL
jgi:hypothetical protein